MIVRSMYPKELPEKVIIGSLGLCILFNILAVSAEEGVLYAGIEINNILLAACAVIGAIFFVYLTWVFIKAILRRRAGAMFLFPGFLFFSKVRLNLFIGILIALSTAFGLI